MAQQLFIILQKNRLRQKGLLKRFTIDCYGNQPTIEDLRSLKAQKYEELKTNMKSDEYTRWFLKYTPKDGSKSKTGKKSKQTKKSKKNKSKMLTKTVSIQGSKLGETIAIEKSALPKTLKDNYGFTPKSTTKTVRYDANKKRRNKKAKRTRKRGKKSRGFLGISF